WVQGDQRRLPVAGGPGDSSTRGDHECHRQSGNDAQYPLLLTHLSLQPGYMPVDMTSRASERRRMHRTAAASVISFYVWSSDLDFFLGKKKFGKWDIRSRGSRRIKNDMEAVHERLLAKNLMRGCESSRERHGPACEVRRRETVVASIATTYAAWYKSGY